MLRVPTTLHLPVACIDDITRSIAICNDTHKFAAYPYSTLQGFRVDNKVKIMSHPEAVRKLHARRTYSDKSLKRSASIAYESNNPWGPSISSVFSRDNVPHSTLYTLIKLPVSAANPSESQLHLHHHGLDVMY